MTTKQMFFEMNNDIWEIIEVSNKEMQELSEDYDNFVQGLTVYSQLKVFLNKELVGKEKALIHELTHCFMYEYGHNQFINKKYTNEDVCEMCACSHKIIDQILKKYSEYYKGEDRDDG